MKMLRRIITIAAVILLLAVAAFLAVLLFAGEDPAEYAEKLDAEIAGVEDAIYTEIHSELSDMGYAAAGESGSTAGPARDQEAETAAAPDFKPDPVVEGKIRQTYTNAFYKLEASAKAMLDQLVADAAAEYEILKENGAVTNQSKVDLASTYIRRADVLEAKYDDSVDLLLIDLQMQLTRIGFSSAEAARIANEYEAVYEAEKEAGRKAMMDRIEAFI